MILRLMNEQERDPGHGDRTPGQEPPAHPMPEPRPGEQAVGDQQQCEHRRHQPRRNVPLG